MSSNVARSADLVVVEAPGTQFIMGSVTRRGVLIENGVLLIRADGCWFSNLRATNGNAGPVRLSVTYSWPGPHGRPLVAIPAIVRQPMESGESAAVDTEGCDPAIARYYGSLASSRVVRTVSVR